MRRVVTIDCGYIFPKYAASFLVYENNEAYIVDTNTSLAVPIILEAMKKAGVSGDRVKWIVITHVHLDHSAGTQALLKACPNANVLAHAHAVRHLTDPTKLVASARKIYGDKLYSELYGEISAVVPEHVQTVVDGETVPFCGKELVIVYTRGHANHHLCLFDPVLNGVFAGDSYGLAYPILQRSGIFIFPSTSHTDFDPRLAKEAIDKIIGLGVNRIFLTHFGQITELAQARKCLHEYLCYAEELLERTLKGKETFEELRGQYETELRTYFERAARLRGLVLNKKDWEIVDMDLRLNAAGIVYSGIKARSEKYE